MAQFTCTSAYNEIKGCVFLIFFVKYCEIISNKVYQVILIKFRFLYSTSM